MYLNSYNIQRIGERIRKERKAAGFSQQGLCEAINEKGIPIDRQKLGEIENGKTGKFDFDILAALCDLFDCEMGYLLCDPGYENKTREKTDFAKLTGLSLTAIQRLTQITYLHDEKGVAHSVTPWQNIYLQKIIESDLYDDFIVCLRNCINAQAEINKYKALSHSAGSSKEMWDFHDKGTNSENERLVNIGKASKAYENLIDGICKSMPKEYDRIGRWMVNGSSTPIHGEI